jgi:tRNA pseudouridine synthase 10
VINNKKLEIEIKGEAGLYIKELVTGDDGRTSPSISELLKNPARVESLDVVKIHLKKSV